MNRLGIALPLVVALGCTNASPTLQPAKTPDAPNAAGIQPQEIDAGSILARPDQENVGDHESPNTQDEKKDPETACINKLGVETAIKVIISCGGNGRFGACGNEKGKWYSAHKDNLMCRDALTVPVREANSCELAAAEMGCQANILAKPTAKDVELIKDIKKCLDVQLKCVKEKCGL